MSDDKEKISEKLTPEELKKKQEEFLKEFMEKNTKDLILPSFSQAFKGNVSKIIKEIEKVKKEVEDKKQTFIELYKTVEDKLQILMKQGQIKLNEDELKKSHSSFVNYENSLNQVLGELESDLVFYSNFLGDNPPQTIKVFKSSIDDASSYLNNKLKSTKKNIKKILKDVRISSSRFFVGLQEQTRKLDYLSAYLKSAKNKK